MNQEIFRFGDLLNLIKSLKYDENNISYPTYGNSADGNTSFGITCGSGFMAAELQKRGVDIKVTDNFAWEDFFKHKYIDIEKIDGVEAVKKYGKEYDYVLMSFQNIHHHLPTIFSKCVWK